MFGRAGIRVRPSGGPKVTAATRRTDRAHSPSHDAWHPTEGPARMSSVDRTQFETLRGLPGKVIRGDIRFANRRATHPAIVAEGIAIENTGGVDLRLNITFNPEVGSKSFNVHAVGVGPICRLDVDGTAHRPCGRSHKHSLQTDRCPDRNLPDSVVDRSDLSGQSVRALFGVFCELGNIEHEGDFHAPDDVVP